MSIDLLIFIAIAVFLVHRLYSVLGSRDGETPPASNPFVEAAGVQTKDEALPLEAATALGQQRILDELPEDAPASLEETLIHIARLDPEFDLKKFKEGAGDAYEYIVRAYAEGDRAALRPLLSDKLYKDFDHGIGVRESNNQKAFSEIRAIPEIAIVDARLDKKTIYLTVKFVAEELSYTEDSTGKIIEGSKTRATDMTDIWTFSRNLRSGDPNWTLVATRTEDA